MRRILYFFSVVGILPLVAQRDIDFAAKTDLVAGTNPYSVAIGDIDGDGLSDIAVANDGGHSISVFENQSTGIGSILFGAKVDFSTGTNPWHVALADLDGDDKLDMVSANAIDVTFSVFRNTSSGDGNFSFATRQNFVPTSRPTCVSVADVDLDGKLDIIVSNFYSNSVSVFRNISSGPGSIAFSAKVDFIVGTNPWKIETADFDKDGKIDLVVTNRNGNNVSVLHNNSSGSGNVSFATKIDFTAGTNPYAVTVGDFNGDDLVDFAITNDGSNTVSVYRNLSSGPGNIGFDTKVDLTTASNPRGLTANDFNNDGKIDLVSSNDVGNSISVFKNLGTGINFAAKVDYTAGTGPYDATSADLDNNGSPEVITANFGSGVSLFKNQTFSGPYISDISPSQGVVGSSITIAGVNFDATPANNTVYFGNAKATVTSASATQLTVIVPYGATYAPVKVIANELTGVSDDRFKVTFPGATTDANTFRPKVSFSTANNFPRAIELGDLDLDGYLDIVSSEDAFSNDDLTVYRNNGTVAFSGYSAGTTYNVSNRPYELTLGDLDGDGKLDIIGALRDSQIIGVLRNTSTGPGSISFASELTFGGALNPGPRSVDVADIDGDGRLDVVTANWSGTFSIFRNSSSGAGIISFDTKQDFSSGLSTQSFRVRVGDIDGDGKPDVVVANEPTDKIAVFRNTSTGPGNITFATGVELTTGDGPYYLELGDLDNDGLLDIAAINNTSNSISTFRNISTSGSVNFQTKSDIFTPTSGPYSIDIEDVNGDGKMDLITANEANDQLIVLENTSPSVGTISFATPVNFDAGGNTQPHVVKLGDINNDGLTDMVAGLFNGQTIGLFLRARLETDFTSFSFIGLPGNATVDAVNHTVNFEVPIGTDVTNLFAIFELSSGATANVGGVDQLSGNNANDFTNPVVYAVTAEDGVTSQNWTVTVTEDDALLAYYPFDGNAIDASGNGNSLTVNGPVLTTDRLGVADAAYSFDGVDDSMFSPDLATQPGNVSLSAWFNYPSGGGTGTHQIVQVRRAAALAVVDDNLVTVLNLNGNLGGDEYIGRGTPTTVTPDEWHLATLTYDGTTFRSYLDGVLFDEYLDADGITYPDPNTIGTIIDVGRTEGGELYQGSIDDIRFYGRVLSANEIAAMAQSGSFVTTWQTTTASETITIPTFSGETYDYAVDWGDGFVEGGLTGDASHTYAVPGTYTVSIKGTFPRIFFNNSGDKDKILSIEQWGDIQWSSMYYAFSGCVNLTYNATDNPDLSNVTNMDSMFRGATSFNGAVGGWDVSNVTVMSATFMEASSFNQNIEQWDVSNVTDMRFMFSSATSFNQPLNGWGAKVQNVEIFTAMFNNTIFNQPLDGWVITGATDIASMFEGASAFNQDISTWDINGVTTLWNFVKDATAFDQNLADWDISTVTLMNRMFENSGMSQANYDATLNGWAHLTAGETQIPLNITLGAATLEYCDGVVARQTLINDYGWTITGDVQNCTDLIAYYPLDNSAADLSGNGNNGTINGPIAASDRFSDANKAMSFDGIDDFISTPDLGVQPTNITLSAWFYYADGAGIGTHQIFEIAGSSALAIFDNQLQTVFNTVEQGFLAPATQVTPDEWHLATLTYDGTTFRSYLDGVLFNTVTNTLAYGPGTVVNIGKASDVSFFDGSIDDIRIYNRALSDVEVDELYTYRGFLPDLQTSTSSFKTTWSITAPNESITIPTFNGETYDYSVDWGDGTVESGFTGDATHTYAAAGTYSVAILGTFPRIYFNWSDGGEKILSVDQWGRNKWTSMMNAFARCINLQINATDAPDLSNATSMRDMFNAATDFNSNIDHWDVSTITDLAGMFAWCVNYNQPLSSWNVSSVADMFSMFYACTLFDQSLATWDISSLTGADNMLSYSGMSTANYDATLQGWESLDLGETQVPSNVTLGAHEIFYSQTAEAARTNLLTTYSWNINGDIPDYLNEIEVSALGASIINGATLTSFDNLTNGTHYQGNAPQVRTFTIDNRGGVDLILGADAVSLTGDAEFTVLTQPIATVPGVGSSTFQIQFAPGAVGSYSAVVSITNNDADESPFTFTIQGNSVTTSTVLNHSYTFENGTANDVVSGANGTILGGTVNSGAYSTINEGDYIELPGPTIALNTYSAVTIEAYITTVAGANPSWSSVSYFGSTLGDFGVDYFYLQAAREDNVSAAGIAIGNYNEPYLVETAVFGAELDDGQSHHLVSVIDANTIWYYIDGVLVGSKFLTGDNQIASLSTDLAYLAKGGYVNDPTWIGSINEFNIYEGVMVASEVETRYASFQRPFMTTWETTAANESITIPTFPNETYNYTVDWGDGTVESGFTGDASHTYTGAGFYTIAIKGTFPRIYFNNGTEGQMKNKIQSIEQWGDIQWSSMSLAFAGCNNLFINATDAPDLTLATDLTEMFSGTAVVNGLSNWNVSNITRMHRMFSGATQFNENLSSWDVSNVFDMYAMFENAPSFNGDVSSWNVSSVTDMSFMFNGATAFNQNITGWQTTSLNTMGGMFLNAPNFNQEIGSWNVSNVVNMDGVFRGASSFNGNISNWDVSNVAAFQNMFDGSTAFNHSLSAWDISSATNVTSMLDGSGMSIANYDATLQGWATLSAGETQIPLGLTLGATGLAYCNGEQERDNLVVSFGWTITGDSKSCGITDGLIAYYPFNSNTNDESGNLLNGVNSGATLAVDRFNNADRAYYFDGSARISVTDPNAFDFTDFTYSLWVSTDLVQTGFRTILSASGDAAWLGQNNSKWETFGICPASNQPDVTLGWHHLVWTKSGINSILYVDNVPFASAVDCGSGAIDVNGVLIGSNEINENFTGFIDDIRIYNRALDASEVEAIYLAENVNNQAPTIANQTFSIDENSAIATTVGTVVANDPDLDPLTYTITAGNGLGAFAINSTTGVITVASVSPLDFETNPTFSLTVQVSDGSISSTATITINLNDIDETVNQAPIVANLIPDQTAIFDQFFSYIVSANTFSDPNGDALTYTASLSDDSGLPAWLNFDAGTQTFSGTPSSSDASIEVKVTATDPGSLSTFDLFMINVQGLNNAPTDIQLTAETIDEGLATGTVIGTLSTTDLDVNDVHIYTIFNDPSTSFDITNQNELISITIFDFEAQNSYPIQIQSDDQNGGVVVKDFTIIINNVNEATTLTLEATNPSSHQSGDFELRALVADGDGLTGVNLYYKAASSDVFLSKNATLANDDFYAATLSAADLDKTGLDYYFSVDDPFGTTRSDTLFVSRVISDNAVSISPTPGSAVTDYTILAFPFDPVNAANVVANLGAANKENWRLVRYGASGNFVDYPSGFSSLNAGVGYWFISKESAALNLGGKSVTLTNGVFRINLQPDANGYTLIGNPFQATLDWADVINHNIARGIITSADVTNTLVGYSGGFNETTSLTQFKGAFVQSTGVILNFEIPASAIVSGSGRLTEEVNTPSEVLLDERDWKFNLFFETPSYRYSLGGIGIHPSAKDGRDIQDLGTLPRFDTYLDLLFDDGSTRSIKQSGDFKHWEFQVKNNLPENQLNLTWDIPVSSDKTILLVDAASNRMYDLKNTREIKLPNDPNATHHLYFGDKATIFKHLDLPFDAYLSTYPNPVEDRFTLELYSNDWKSVSLEMISLDGKSYRLDQKQMNKGLNTISVDLSTIGIPSGIYMLRVDQVIATKIIKK